MGNLTSLLNGGAPEPALDPPEVQLRHAMQERGITPPHTIIMDGTLRRFSDGTRNKNCWYIIYNDGFCAGAFGDWSEGEEGHKWRANMGRQLTEKEILDYEAAAEKAQKERQEKQSAEWKKKGEEATKIWTDAPPAPDDHPYLVKKQIKANGAKLLGDKLLTPLFGVDGSLQSYQTIAPDGSKLFFSGGKTRGGFWWIGDINKSEKVFVCEGFATAATIHEVSGCAVIVAYNAGNLPTVAEQTREFLQGKNVVCVADNDASGVGQKRAEQTGYSVVMPPIIGMDANDYHNAGHDLAAVLGVNKKPQPFLLSFNDFVKKPAPLKWWIKGHIQADSLMMMHGPSGVGKTFVVLDMILSVASGQEAWFGHKVTKGDVVYLAGEGYHGLKGRALAWAQNHDYESMRVHFSTDGCDLNTDLGLAKVVDGITKEKLKPNIIVVDTLHRFMSGDENSAMDTKSMLDACAKLQRLYGCTVILVHHTGVSQEAQARARGSSAWRGALDTELSVQKDKMGNLSLVQQKSKDTELQKQLHFELLSTPILGWVDDDGEQSATAIVSQLDEPKFQKREKTDDKTQDFLREFEDAWKAKSQQFDPQGRARMTRKELVSYLMESGVTQNTAYEYTRPGARGKIISTLIAAQKVVESDNIYTLMDEESNMVLKLI